MKYMSRFAMVVALAAALVGCGERVEVPPGHVGKTMGNEHLQTQMTIEYTLQDNSRQPKQTDEERAKRFEELTNYKED